MSELLVATVLSSFLLSVGHCIGMCGGFVIAYSSKLSGFDKTTAALYSLGYHLARVFAYVLLGFLVGFFGMFISFSPKVGGFIHFVVGLFLAFVGAAFILRGNLLKFIENDKLWLKFFSKPTKKALQSNSLRSLLLLGFLNGFLPCGVVYTFLATAFLSKSVVSATLIMFAFGVATIPVMFGISLVSSFLNFKFQKTMLFISSALIIVFGIYNSFLGFREVVNG